MIKINVDWEDDKFKEFKEKYVEHIFYNLQKKNVNEIPEIILNDEKKSLDEVKLEKILIGKIFLNKEIDNVVQIILKSKSKSKRKSINKNKAIDNLQKQLSIEKNMQ